MLFVKDKAFYKRFWFLTLTIAAQNLIVYSVNLADNVMLGRYTQDALSGVALCNQIWFMLQMLVGGIGEGLLVFASRSWGEGDLPSVRRITNICMKLAVAVATVFGAVVWLLPTQTLGLLSNDAAVVAEGAKYLRILAFTYPMFAVSSTLLSMLRSVEVVRIGLAVNCSALVVNVGLNYALIFGNWGFPALGVEGAAWATLAARAVELAIAIGFVAFEKRIRLGIRAFGRIDTALLRAYLRRGSPVLFSSLSWGVAMTVQTAILGHMGSNAIAANSIATTVFSIISVVAYGTASATAVLIGKTIGEGETAKIRGYAKTLQILFLAVGLATGAVIFLAKDWVIGLYTVTPEATNLAMIFMSVLAVTAIGTAYQMPSLTGIVRAGGDTSFVLWNDIIFQYGIILPAALLAAFVFVAPPLVIFAILKSDQILKCGVALVKVNRFRWIRALR